MGRKTTQRKVELARRRAARAKLEDKADALRKKAATARTRATRLDYIARAVELEGQIDAMPLRRGSGTGSRKKTKKKANMNGFLRALGGG